MSFDYKKYSLEQLENWVHDAMSAGEATPQEIYDTIRKVVEENYYIHKVQTSNAYELLSLLNGNGKGHFEAYDDVIQFKETLNCDKDDPSPECQNAWNNFWEENYYPEQIDNDKVVKWQLPIEVDGLTGECFVNFPDDLLEAANLKEGDTVKWIDRGDGSFELRKETKPLEIGEC